VNSGANDRTSYIVQGEYRVSRDPAEVLSTVLGSCVAVCMWDPSARVGGMNHFLLPAAPGQGDAKMLRYGAHAMEVLINELLKPEPQARLAKAMPLGPVNTNAFKTGILSEAEMLKVNTHPSNIGKQLLIDPNFYIGRLDVLTERFERIKQRRG
jgi:hypothetical protein